MKEETSLTIDYNKIKVFYPKLTLKDWHSFVDEIGNFMEEYLHEYKEEE